MSLFNSTGNFQQKERKLLERFDLQNMSNIKEKKNVRKLVCELAGGPFDEYVSLAARRDSEQLLRILVEQNFIIIRQLDRIANAFSSATRANNQTQSVESVNIDQPHNVNYTQYDSPIDDVWE